MYECVNTLSHNTLQACMGIAIKKLLKSRILQQREV